MFNVVFKVVGEMKWLGFMKGGEHCVTYICTYTLFNLEFKVAKDRLVSSWASVS